MTNHSPHNRPIIHAVSDAKLMAVLGPTNTGKTHYAIERMCGYASGMIGLPLRLLAREIYDRVVALKGANAVALITGEEKIIPRLPSYFVCTVEAMPLERHVDFLCVDEIQLCGDAERGHVFTDRLLHARGRFETLFLGAATFKPLFHRLFPGAEIMLRERLSHLSYSGPKKLTRLPKRTAIVAFSTEKVYAIAELIRRQRGGAAVVMGGLSPKTRNAQVDLFQRGEVDFLVATDAIGMGLNMDIAHVAFSGMTKFDGKSTRWLTAQEIGQIAGRAGRHMSDGTFGVTGDCPDLDDDLVHAIENHEFMPLDAAQWRNHKLDFSTLDALLKSLTLPSHTPGLHLAKEALDEKALRALAQDEDVAAKIKNPVSLRTLWEACQLPDFRKVGMDEYLKLVSLLFWSRLSPEGVVPDDWFAAQVADLDKMEGDVDTLSSRLSGVRTLTYIAHRGQWLKQTEHWRAATRDLEDRLSDKLHEALMQRFIDQRTSALLKALDAEEAPRPEVKADGQVTLEGHVVGELKGLSFSPGATDSLIADKALRQAAFRAVRPVLIDRLRMLGQSASKTFRLKGHQVLWNGEAVAEIEPSDYFAPRIRLIDAPDHPSLAANAVKRITDYLHQMAQHQFKGLWKAKQAADAEGTPPNVRAIAFRLFENGGVLHRDETLKLSPEDKAALKALGVAGHRYAWFLPDMLSPKLRPLMQAFGKAEGQRQHSRKGQLLLDDYGPVAMKTLSQIDKLMNTARYQKGVVYFKPSDFEPLGLSEKQRDKLMQALGLIKVEPITVTEEVVVTVPAEAAAPAKKRRRRRKPTAKDAVAETVVSEAPLEAAEAEAVVDEAQPPIDTPLIETPEIAEASAETPAEITSEAMPEPASVPETASMPETASIIETREVQLLGWRQKNYEPREPRHRQRPEGANGDKPAYKGRPKSHGAAEAKGGHHKHGKRPDQAGGKRPDRPAKPQNREPAINPYSPFADLRARLAEKVSQD